MQRRFVNATFGGRAWARLLYALLAAPLGLLGLAYLLLVLLPAVLLAVATIGVPVLAAGVQGARVLGAAHRWLAGALLAVHIPPPARRRPARGLLGWLGAALSDATGWRAMLHLAVKAPLGVVVSAATMTVWLAGAVALAFPVLAPRAVTEPDGPVQVGLGEYHINTWPRVAVLAGIGVLILLAAPWVTRALVWPDSWLAAGLLGPTRTDRLQAARALAVDDAAAQLRRIERDLHDGAQAQLVALAMKLGLAKEELATGDAATALTLVDTAHHSAKQALVELRDLARGIHPPILDSGLAPALRTLAARSAVPVDLHLQLPVRPAPAIETVAYFAAAELLANIAKHARANRATLRLATASPGWLRLSVADDGIGGAQPAGGLAGLADRVRAVDGRLEITSPPGGPTVVAVHLPEHP